MGLVATPALGVTIRVDYSQDGSGFFSAGSSAGLQRRAAVDAAAAFYSDILQDSLAPVVVPPRYQSPAGGWAEFYLEMADPSDPDNLNVSVQMPTYTIAQDEFVVFAGSAAIPGVQIASAGLGSAGYLSALSADDIPIVNQTVQDFFDAITTRGKTSGFANWGGTISFDSGVAWNTNLSQPPDSGQSDLYSVALHEMGHLLGFNRTVFQEQGLISGDNFMGSAATNLYGGPAPLKPDSSHWAEGTMSTTYEGGTSQETLYDPSFNGSVRKGLTLLDAAALSDLGWSVAPAQPMPGDFNHDSVVDAADYSVWRRGMPGEYTQADYQLWRENYGASSQSTASANEAPAPTALVLVLAAMPCLGWRRC